MDRISILSTHTPHKHHFCMCVVWLCSVYVVCYYNLAKELCALFGRLEGSGIESKTVRYDCLTLNLCDF